MSRKKTVGGGWERGGPIPADFSFFNHLCPIKAAMLWRQWIDELGPACGIWHRWEVHPGVEDDCGIRPVVGRLAGLHNDHKVVATAIEGKRQAVAARVMGRLRHPATGGLSRRDAECVSEEVRHIVAEG